MPFKSKATLEAERLAAESAGVVKDPIRSDNTELKPIATPIPEVASISDETSTEVIVPVEPVVIVEEPVIVPVQPVVIVEEPKGPRYSVNTLIGRYIKNRYSIDAMLAVINTQLAASIVREIETTFTLIRTAIDPSKLDIITGPMIYSPDVELGLSTYNINTFFRNAKNRVVYIGDVTSVNDLIGVLESITMRVMHVVKLVRLDLSIPKIAGGVASLLKAYPDSYIVKGQGNVVFWISNSSDTFIFNMIDLMSLGNVTAEDIMSGVYGDVVDLRE